MARRICYRDNFNGGDPGMTSQNEGTAKEALSLIEYGRGIEREVKSPGPIFWIIVGIWITLAFQRMMDLVWWF